MRPGAARRAAGGTPRGCPLRCRPGEGGKRPLSAARGTALTIDTPHGPSEVHVARPRAPRGLLVLGHGAGGSIDAPDLLAVADVAVQLGWVAARVIAPYRVAGRRAPPAPPALDASWLPVVDALRHRRGLRGIPLLVGGRSSGARTACRTARGCDAAGVLALAFPLTPPRRPGRSRAAELAAAGVPVLVVQGERDPFGGPVALAALRLPGVEVVPVPGADHALRSAAAVAGVRIAAARWLQSLGERAT